MDIIMIILSWLQGVPNWLIGIFVIVFAYYLYSTWTFSIFKELGFPYIKPVPFIGAEMRSFKIGVHAYDVEQRKVFNRKCYGGFFGRIPGLMLGSEEAIKQVCIKDFNSAPNHWEIGMRGMMLFSLFDSRNERWHNQRNTLSPSFTASKLRRMVPWIQKSAANFANSVRQKAEEGENFEMKHRAGLMTMDIIAGTGFGIDTDSFADENNEFIRNAKALSDLSFLSPTFIIIIFFRFLIPVMDLFGICMFKQWIADHYDRIIGQAIKERKKETDEDSSTTRTDLLQLMINRLIETPADKTKARTDKAGVWYEKGFTEAEIKANGMLLITGSYDTTATAIAFLCYNLAVHPEVQERVLEEINTVLRGEAPDYDTVGRLPYLEQCLAESLRLYPPALRTDRQLERDIIIEGKRVPKGMPVSIPIYAIHHDPEFWPEPEKFDPDRFSPENRPGKDDVRYLPFGIGPRMCIAKRLGELEVKIAVARLLQTVRLTTCEKTEIPITIRGDGLMKPKNGIYLTAEVREQE